MATRSYDKDKPRLNSWPYRDYVIRSLNSDKPYTRFVQEQLAGDVLFPDNPEGVVATGFIAAGPWDLVGHAELREGTTDKQIARLLDRDDMVTATMSTFISLTVHCARCHDHKFDPIKQEDYYSLQADFAGVDRADRSYDFDRQTHRRRQLLLRQKQEIQVELQRTRQGQANPPVRKLPRSTPGSGPGWRTSCTPPARRTKRKLLKKQLKVQDDSLHKAQRAGGRAGRLSYPFRDRTAERKNEEVDQLLEPLGKPARLCRNNFFQRDQNFRPALLPRPIHLLARGNVQAPGQPVGPGAISCITTLPSRFNLEDPNDEGGRRAALAKWIVDPNNMLTWRSIVNRVWQYHFGAGIVDTPNDFGRMGSLPTHPELLDCWPCGSETRPGVFEKPG
jgi:hypothetical protein